MLGFSPLGAVALGEFSDSNKAVVADAATFTITGYDAGLYASRLLSADVGTFTVTGYGVEFIRSSKGLRVIPGGGSRGLAARAGGGSKGLRISA
jgi:hypothetical protein